VRAAVVLHKRIQTEINKFNSIGQKKNCRKTAPLVAGPTAAELFFSAAEKQARHVEFRWTKKEKETNCVA
jgi:hypothetical protein